MENKRLFLAKKGMTLSEIEAALKLANCGTEQSHPLTKKQEAAASHIVTSPLPSAVEANTSLFRRLLKWIKNIILAGCFAFTAYKLLAKVQQLQL